MWAMLEHLLLLLLERGCLVCTCECGGVGEFHSMCVSRVAVTGYDRQSLGLCGTGDSSATVLVLALPSGELPWLLPPSGPHLALYALRRHTGTGMGGYKQEGAHGRDQKVGMDPRATRGLSVEVGKCATVPHVMNYQHCRRSSTCHARPGRTRASGGVLLLGT